MSEPSQEPESRRKSIKEAILNRRMLICAFTGFSSGLPLYLLIQLVPAWLRVEGVGLAEIGFFTLVGLPYTWKFVWSPIMDRYTLPFLGRRRGWMLVTQLALFLTIATMGFLDPTMSIWTIAYLAAAVAFFSASQDIVLDAYRRELLPDQELGIGNAIHVQTYRLSGLVPGSLALILADHLPWTTVFIVVAAFMAVGILLTLVIQEAIADPSPPRTLQEAIVEPFREFVRRKGPRSAALILAFLFLYKLGDNMATALQTPFFVDVGFSLTQIGSIAKFSSLIAAIVGGLSGGIIMIKLGINLAEFAPNAKVLHLDVDPAEVGKLRRPDVALVGSLEASLEALDSSLDIGSWRVTCARLKEEHQWDYDMPADGIYGPRFLKKLSEAADPGTIFACDVGQHQMWVAQHCRFERPEQHLTSAGLGTMGYGLPAAIGAQFGCPDRTVVNVTGDGSIMMNFQELVTLARYRVPVKIVVLDNQSLGLVRQWQELFFEGRYSEVDLSDNPDFVRVAESLGIPASRLEQASDEDDVIEKLLRGSGMHLLHVRIDREANVWPLVPPNTSNSEMLVGAHK